MKKLIVFAALIALNLSAFADEIDDMFDEEDIDALATQTAILSEGKRANALWTTLKFCDKPSSAYSKSTLKRAAEINRRKLIYIADNVEKRPAKVEELLRKDCKFEQTEIELRAKLERHLYNAFSAKSANERDFELDAAKANFELLKLALMKREALWPKVK